MPHLITRAQALARLERERKVDCVPCALCASPEVIARSESSVAVLSRYPIRWGHVQVIPERHALRMQELSARQWADAAALAHATACALERVLDPSRTFVAALGTSEGGLPMTFPHLHFNVIPVAERGARPAAVLTWEHGVYEGSQEEWQVLGDLLRGALLSP